MSPAEQMANICDPELGPGAEVLTPDVVFEGPDLSLSIADRRNIIDVLTPDDDPIEVKADTDVQKRRRLPDDLRSLKPGENLFRGGYIFCRRRKGIGLMRIVGMCISTGNSGVNKDGWNCSSLKQHQFMPFGFMKIDMSEFDIPYPETDVDRGSQYHFPEEESNIKLLEAVIYHGDKKKDG